MKESRYAQPYNDSIPIVSVLLFRWHLLLFILAMNLICTIPVYAWWSGTPPYTGIESTHDIIGKKAFELVSDDLKNEFLKTNANFISDSNGNRGYLWYSYKIGHDTEAHAKEARRNGGPIDDHFKKFLDFYRNNNREEAAKYLGYCIHLIEDMNVPAHALNIPHAPLKIYDWSFFNMKGDYFEAAAAFYPNITLRGPISEITTPYNPATYYYDAAKWQTINTVATMGYTGYWQAGIEGVDPNYYGDGAQGHYGGIILGVDCFPFYSMNDLEEWLLLNQLNQSVNYVGQFLLGVDRILSAVNEDVYEENDTLSSAVDVDVPFSEASLKCNDDDWFKVWVQTDEKIYVTITLDDSLGDLDLYLYDASGNQLSSSTSTTNQETINYGPSSTTAYYYIKVHGYNNAKNMYDMSMSTYTTNSPDLRAKTTIKKSSVVTEGDDFWISWYIYNSGLSAAGASHASFYISTNGNYSISGDYYIGDVYVKPLGPLTGTWVTLSFIMPNLSSGAYPVWNKVVVDSWGEVAEGIEGSGPFVSVNSVFTAYDVRTLTGLRIIGSSSIDEGGSAAYTAIASWSDGTTSTVTPTWSENSSYASINTSGLLTTTSVSGNTTVTVTTGYASGGVTKTATKAVTIRDITATLTGLAIYGPSSVVESTSAEYMAVADWSDGSSSLITPSWSENSTYSSINSGGILTAAAVTSSQSVTITATYTASGVTKTGTKTVTIVNADTTPQSFTFTDHTDVALNTVVTANAITVWGINTGATISITGGVYSINGGSYTSAPGTVHNGDIVTVRITASGAYGKIANAILTIGGVSDTFSVTTLNNSTVCTNPPAKVNSNYFYNIQNVYDNASDDDTVLLQSDIFNETVFLDRYVTTIIQGGYNCQYDTNTGYTIIDGSLIISNGTVTVEKLIIK